VSIVEPDPHAMFARDCGGESIVVLMAGACGEGVMRLRPHRLQDGL
jgi:hypothetical protein